MPPVSNLDDAWSSFFHTIPTQENKGIAPTQLQGQTVCLGVNSILAIDQSANGANHRHHNADSTNPGGSHIEERRSHHHHSMEARIDIFNDVGQLHKEQLDEIVQLHEGKLEQVHSHAIHQRPINPRHVHERKRRATAQGVRRCKGTCNNQSDQVCTNLRSWKTS